MIDSIKCTRQQSRSRRQGDEGTDRVRDRKDGIKLKLVRYICSRLLIPLPLIPDSVCWLS